MDFFLENKLFTCCSLGVTVGSLYLLKSAYKKYNQTDELMEKGRKISELQNDKKIRKFSKLGPTREHPHQKKLDFYVGDLARGSSTCFDQKVNRETSYVYKICLTGGPNSGKTTSKTFICEKLTERGYKVYTVPITYNLTMENGGNNISVLDHDNLVKLHTYLMKLQMDLEDYFVSLAALDNEKAIILCDRGVMDTKTQVSSDVWESILVEQDWNVINLRDKRYDAVIHLLTSLEEEYNKTNAKISQQEKSEWSAGLDEKLKDAYMAHPHYKIIENTGTDFQSKINKVFSVVSKYIGMPMLKTFIRKFLIEIPSFPDDINFEEFQVTEVFLRGEEGAETKIRKRGQNEIYTYIHSITKKTIDGHRNETKKILSARDYNILLSQKDDNYKPLEKVRKCFIWRQQLYLIDSIKIKENEYANILRFDTQAKDSECDIPNFLRVVKEVTDDENYSSSYIAKIKK